MFRKYILLITIFFLLPYGCAHKDAAAAQTKTVLQADGVIWSFAFISADEILLTLRHGDLYYANLASGVQTPLPVPAIAATGQGGLLDVHLHTADSATYIYLTYSTEINDQLTTALARGIWTGQTIQNLAPIFIAQVKGNSGRHFGSRLYIDKQHIYMTVGDRGERDYAQDLSYHNGKILRLNLDGSAAAGNPFADNADALPEIWSYGHRNPQGIDYDLATGQLYSAEFGPRGGDELNLIHPGNNYGWPLITYGREYWGPSIGSTHDPAMQQPVTYWTPSISPSGMAFYQGDKIPQWQGNLFLANLSSQHLRRLVLQNGEVTQQQELLKNLDERIRHVRSSPDGYLYISTDSGKLIKIMGVK